MRRVATPPRSTGWQQAVALAFGLWGTLGLLGSSALWAQASPSWLDTCEAALFRQGYASESLESRFSRLEQQAFGETFSDPLPEREKRLKWTLRHVLSSQPVPQAMPSRAPSAPAATLGVPDATDYPSVTAMEQTLFQQAYRQEDIATRLARLERRVFNGTFVQLPLADRVDQLTRKIPQALFGQPSSDASAPVVRPAPPSAEASAYLQAVSQAESLVLGHENSQSLLSERLETLEWRLFGRPYVGESPDTRFRRIQARLGLPSPSSPTAYSWATTPMVETTTQWTVPGGQTATRQSYTTVQTPTGTSQRVSRQQMTAGGPGTVVYTETRTWPLPSANPHFRLFRRRPPGSDPAYFAPLAPLSPLSEAAPLSSPASLSAQTPARRLPRGLKARPAVSPASPGLSAAGLPVAAAAPRLPRGVKARRASVPPPSPPPVYDPRTQAVLEEYDALSAPPPFLSTPLAAGETSSGSPQTPLSAVWARQLERLERQTLGSVRQDLPVEGRLSLLEARLLGETFDAFSPAARIFNLQRRYFRNPLNRLSFAFRPDARDDAALLSPMADLPPLLGPETNAQQRP